jgi:hypothetical protein
MARYPQFIGPTYTLPSLLAGVERTVNWYPTVNASTGQPWLMPTPGLTAWAQVGSGPIRGMFAQNNRLFVVSGFGYYEVFPNRTATLWGNVGSDGRPVTIHSNGTAGDQNFIVSARKGYIHTLSTNTFIQITDPDFPSQEASMGFFIDGYFGVVVLNSTTFKLSNLLDGEAWDGLDIAQRSWANDNIVTAITNHRELVLLGSQTSEIWVDTGASFPLAPIQGVFIEGGSYAPFSAAKLDNTIYYLDGDERGHAIVRRLNGYTPERVSTDAVEFHLSRYSTLQDAIGFSYQQDGHAFYVLYAPSGDVHWVYDAATGQWHERADWDTDRMDWIPWTPRAHAFVFGKHLVGDRQSGVIYEMRLDAYQDTVIAS